MTLLHYDTVPAGAIGEKVDANHWFLPISVVCAGTGEKGEHGGTPLQVRERQSGARNRVFCSLSGGHLPSLSLTRVARCCTATENPGF